MMLRRLWALFRRDLLAARGSVLMAAGIIVIWDAFLLTRAGRWPSGALELSLWAPVFISLSWVALASLQAWYREWQQGTAHYTLAFPMPAWSLVTVKAAVALTETMFLGLVAIAAGWPLYSKAIVKAIVNYMRQIAPGLFWTTVAANGLKLGLVLAVILFAVSLLVQFSYLLGRAARIWPAALVPLSAATGAWAGLRIGGILNLFLRWVPPMHIVVVGDVGRVLELIADPISPAPAISIGAVALGLLALDSAIVAKWLDV